MVLTCLGIFLFTTWHCRLLGFTVVHPSVIASDLNACSTSKLRNTMIYNLCTIVNFNNCLNNSIRERSGLFFLTRKWHGTDLWKTMLVSLLGSSTLYLSWYDSDLFVCKSCYLLVLTMLPLACQWKAVIALIEYLEAWWLLWVLWVPFVTYPHEFLVCICQIFY